MVDTDDTDTISLEDYLTCDSSSKTNDTNKEASVSNFSTERNVFDASNCGGPHLLTKSSSIEELPLYVERERGDHGIAVSNTHSLSSSKFNRSVSCTPVDLRQISSKMPLCLLEEDEESEEELKQLIPASFTTVPSPMTQTDLTACKAAGASPVTTSSHMVSTASPHSKKYPLITTTGNNCMASASTGASNVRGNRSPIVSVTPVSTVAVSTVSMIPVTYVSTIIAPISSSGMPFPLNTTLDTVKLNHASKTLSQDKELGSNRLSRKRELEPCLATSSSTQQDSIMTTQTRTILRDFLYKQKSSANHQSNSVNKLNGHIASTTEATDAKPAKRMKPASKPQPPVTSYGAFLREYQSEFSRDSLSSQDLARKLGKVWGSLTKAMKQEYHVKSQVDQYRFLRELKEFLWSEFEGSAEYSVVSNLVDQTIADTQQYNTAELSCHLCNISFCNQFRKNSHFCGRPHNNELLSRLVHLIEESCTVVDDLGEESNQGLVDAPFSYDEEDNTFESLEHLVSNYCHDLQACSESSSSSARSPTRGVDGKEGIDTFESDDDGEYEEEAAASEDATEPSANAEPSINTAEDGTELSVAQQLIGQMEINTQSLSLEKDNHLELISCYTHLIEREYEIQHWSLAYQEAIEKCLRQLQANRDSLQRLLNLIDRCRETATVNVSSCNEFH